MSDAPLSIAAAFTLGLLSATHCLGMCASIIGALSLSLPGPAQRRRQALFVLLYNLGRISSYTLAGAIAGGLGAQLLTHISPEFGHAVLRYLSAGMLLAIGLHLGGWLPQMSRLENLGGPLWRRLQPWAQRLLPVRSPTRAFTYGLVWGWLPCGMVYTLALWSAAAGSAWNGALVMAAFGLGSLPAMLISGMMAQRVLSMIRKPSVRRVIGLSLGLSALATLSLPVAFKSFAPAQDAPLHHVSQWQP